VGGSALFAGATGGVYLSTDDGSSWVAAANSGLPSNSTINALAIGGDNLWGVAEDWGVYLSTNNGALWTGVNAGLPENSVYALALSGDTVFVGFGAGLGAYRSTNNGSSWASANTGMQFPTVSAFAVSGNNIFAGTQNGVFLSTDNGSSWKAAGAGLPTDGRVGAFAVVGMDGHGLELTSMADIPAGTGLGSSSSFTTALLKALHAHKKNLVHPAELAAQACEIELGRLQEPIGKQDQYIAAYGGITCFKFLPGGKVEAWPLKISNQTRHNLEDNLLLFFTGYSRSASAILKEQDQKSKQDDKSMIENLHFVKDLGLQSQRALEAGDLRGFARLMDVHWQRKKQRSGGMSNPKINEWYDLALANGALGGKLIGAGGGGFLMFYAEDKTKLRLAMTQAGLKEVRFRFDFEGTKLVIS